MNLIIMSEIIPYNYSEVDAPPNCEKPTVHFYDFTHKNKQITADAYLFTYPSDNVRISIKANSIELAYEMDNFIRYEYRMRERWLTIFEAYTFFSGRNKAKVKAYLYAHFDEQDQFIRDKMKVRQGEEFCNLERLIRKEKLLPKALIK